MARNAVTRRRMAVFLCLQFGLIALFLALLIAFYFARGIDPVQAQTIMICHDDFGTPEELIDAAGEAGEPYYMLTPLEADLYIAAVIDNRPEASRGLSALVVEAGGGAYLYMIRDGVACTPRLGTMPVAHGKAMEAVYGQPI
jgi:hypothetical protein